MGKIIDADFGGRNADDRYCAACQERFPRRSALCPRCGGALSLWATHAAAGRKRKSRSKLVGATATLLLIAAVIIAKLLGAFFV